MPYRLSVGKTLDGRDLAAITEGGHPQINPDETCVVCAVALIDNLPNRDAEAWFKQQVRDRPWETRQ